MVEELYIIHNGKRERLDLSIPSGITLNFKSNVFGDLSKITASYSYTFKLPMTANNRRVLDMADDIRHQSGMICKRLKAEFAQNGIPLFKGANLYVESVEKSYNAVMTWGAIDGFQTLKDNDCSLNTLPHTETVVVFGGNVPNSVMFETANNGIGEKDNSESVLMPEYSCGLPFRIMERTIYNQGKNSTYYHYYKYKDDRSIDGESLGYPVCYPVVPVRHLIDVINQHFGTRFKLSKPFEYSSIQNGYRKTDRYDILYRGVLPCTAKNLNYDQLTERSMVLSSFGFTNDNLYGDTFDKIIYIQEGGDDIKSLLYIGGVARVSADRCPFDVTTHSDNKRYSIVPKLYGLGAKLYGRLVLTFEELHENNSDRHPGSNASRGDTSSATDVPKLSIIQVRGGYVSRRPKFTITEVASFEGEYVGKTSDGYYIYEYDFREFEGLEELEMSNLTAQGIYFSFNEKVKSIDSGSGITIIPNYDSVLRGQPMDVYQSLPDISCMTFIKTLFFMMGAYPTTTADGDIVPVFYDDFFDNIDTSLNWSDKITTSDSVLPNKIVFKAGDVGQRNYYLTKTDSLEKDEDEEREKTDIYLSGEGIVLCANEVLDLEKTIIQLPYSAPYHQNRKSPRYNTGDTFKGWEYHNKEFTACTPDPIFGLIDTDTVVTTKKDVSTGAVLERTEVTQWTMRCWNGFADLESNPSFAYLQRILQNPYVITEYLNLNEWDLRDIDYSIPVYLDKYNSYFAIVSIQRDSKGKCKCELLKLPV